MHTLLTNEFSQFDVNVIFSSPLFVNPMLGSFLLLGDFMVFEVVPTILLRCLGFFQKD